MVRISDTTSDNRQGVTDEAAAPDDATDAEWDALTIDGHHERHVYRMSALGGDLSQLVAGALGVTQGPMPRWLQPYLDEGTAAEPAILAKFHDKFAMRAANYQELATLKEQGVIAGYNPAEKQVQVWLEVGTSALVRGHTDEIVRVNPKGKTPYYAVVEAKKLRPTLWNILLANDEHKRDLFSGDGTLVKYGWQVAALHHATGLPVYFVAGQYDPDADDGKGEVVSIFVRLITSETVPYSLAQVKARVMKAESHAKKGVVPQCEHADDACVYGAEDFCLGKPEKQWDDLDDQEFGKLLGLHYAEGIDASLHDEQKAAKKNRDKLKDQIDKLIAEKGYARGALYHVWDEAGNEFEFEWVQETVQARAYTKSYPKVKVIGELAHDAPEDEG